MFTLMFKHNYYRAIKVSQVTHIAQKINNFKKIYFLILKKHQMLCKPTTISFKTKKRNRNFVFIIKIFVFIYSFVETSRGGTKSDCKIDWLWVRSPLEEMKYLLKFIFTFLRSGVEAKRGIELCHLTRNASRMRQKVGNGVS